MPQPEAVSGPREGDLRGEGRVGGAHKGLLDDGAGHKAREIIGSDEGKWGGDDNKGRAQAIEGPGPSKGPGHVG